MRQGTNADLYFTTRKKERKKDDNLLADRTSCQEVDLERKSKRVETCNIVHVSSPISTTE